jgi:hypothetical protein
MCVTLEGRDNSIGLETHTATSFVLIDPTILHGQMASASRHVIPNISTKVSFPDSYFMVDFVAKDTSREVISAMSPVRYPARV